MKHGLRTAFTILASLIISLSISLPALAVPQLPSSFYGTVKVNNANVPDGTSVQALIDGQVYANTVTQTYQGSSVYALDVGSDDTDTPAQDGGREGDPIQFKIGGVIAAQTGTWHTGTNVNLDLTASTSTTPVATPQVTLTPVPTQTTIPTQLPTSIPATARPSEPTATTTVQSSPVATAGGLASPTATSTLRSSQATTQPAQPSPTRTRQKQPSLSQVASDNTPINGTANSSNLVVDFLMGIFVVFVGYLVTQRPPAAPSRSRRQ